VVLATQENNKMIRHTYILLLVTITVFACRPVKKVQKVEEAISKKDTVETVVITQTPSVDSAKLIDRGIIR
jgi:hypothetical protein